MTARRDLAILAEAGYARRTHGGAVLPELAAHEDSFQSRLEQDIEVKIRLAKAVAATLTPDETVFIDSSSSAYFVVREILESGLPMTVLTNSLPVMTRRQHRRTPGRPDRPRRELPQADPLLRRRRDGTHDRTLLR